MRVLFVSSDVGGDRPLQINKERDIIRNAVGDANIATIDKASLHVLRQNLSRHADVHVAHFACHGGLEARLIELVRERCSDQNIQIDARLNELVRQRCSEQTIQTKGLNKLAHDELTTLCIGAIRHLLSGHSTTAFPLIPGEQLSLADLEQLEGGIVLHPDPLNATLRNSHYQIVPPDGLAGMFGICSQLRCVVLNCCVSALQARKFALQEHVQYVISVRGRISDDAAIIFSQAFYAELLSRGEVQNAYGFACASLDATFRQRDREKQVEDDLGHPGIWVRPGTPSPSPPSSPSPAPQRLQFAIDVGMSKSGIELEDADLKLKVLNFLQRQLRRMDLRVGADDFEVEDYMTSFSITLEPRDNLGMTEEEAKRLSDRLNAEFDLRDRERVTIIGMRRGSLILDCVGPMSAFAKLHAAWSNQSLTVDGMPAIGEPQLAPHYQPFCRLHCVIRGTTSAYARLCACAEQAELLGHTDFRVISLPRGTFTLELGKPTEQERQPVVPPLPLSRLESIGDVASEVHSTASIVPLSRQGSSGDVASDVLEHSIVSSAISAMRTEVFVKPSSSAKPNAASSGADVANLGELGDDTEVQFGLRTPREEIPHIFSRAASPSRDMRTQAYFAWSRLEDHTKESHLGDVLALLESSSEAVRKTGILMFGAMAVETRRRSGERIANFMLSEQACEATMQLPDVLAKLEDSTVHQVAGILVDKLQAHKTSTRERALHTFESLNASARTGQQQAIVDLLLHPDPEVCKVAEVAFGLLPDKPSCYVCHRGLSAPDLLDELLHDLAICEQCDHAHRQKRIESYRKRAIQREIASAVAAQQQSTEVLF